MLLYDVYLVCSDILVFTSVAFSVDSTKSDHSDRVFSDQSDMEVTDASGTQVINEDVLFLSEREDQGAKKLNSCDYSTVWYITIVTSISLTLA